MNEFERLLNGWWIVPPWLVGGVVPSGAAMGACPSFKNPVGTDQTAVVAAQPVH